MKSILIFITLIFNVSSIYAQSFTGANQNQDISGDWVFWKSTNYDHPHLKVKESQELRIVISGGKIMDSTGCQIPIQKVTGFAFSPFSLMFKSDATEKSITNFFKAQFDVSIDFKGEHWGYEPNLGNKNPCNDFTSSEFFVFPSQLIFAYGNSFFSYKKPAMNNAAINTYGRKITLLPFEFKKYNDWCFGSNKRNRYGEYIQTPSSNCTVFYHPFNLGKSDADPLGSLLGSYNYIFNLGMEYAHPLDYDNPVKHGLHPIVLFFTPFKNVLIALVDDRETHNEQHRGANYREDLLAPTFVTILNNKIIQTLAVDGQFSIDRNHQITVIDSDWFNHRTKDRIYKIQEDGTFKRIQ